MVACLFARRGVRNGARHAAHLAVLLVELATDRDLLMRGSSVGGSRSEEERGGETHVVVAHLAALGLVNAEDLVLLRGAELEARDVVDDE